MTEFAKKHGLNPSCLCKVSNGKSSNHKGWVSVDSADLTIVG